MQPWDRLQMTETQDLRYLWLSRFRRRLLDLDHNLESFSLSLFEILLRYEPAPTIRKKLTDLTCRVSVDAKQKIADVRKGIDTTAFAGSQ